MGKTAKKVGRPVKKAKAGERVPLGLRVTADMKARLDEAAERSGRSQSQEAEFRLAQSFEWERETKTAQQWLAEARDVVNGKLEAALRRAGYTPISGIPGGRYWASPDADLSKINMGIDAAQVVRDMQPDLVRALAEALGKFAKQSGGDVD